MEKWVERNKAIFLASAKKASQRGVTREVVVDLLEAIGRCVRRWAE